MSDVCDALFSISILTLMVIAHVLCWSMRHSSSCFSTGSLQCNITANAPNRLHRATIMTALITRPVCHKRETRAASLTVRWPLCHNRCMSIWYWATVDRCEYLQNISQHNFVSGSRVIALRFTKFAQWRPKQFSLGGYNPGSLGHGSPRRVQGKTPVDLGNFVRQNLKQFADIVYRFWLQKRSKFENWTQFTSWFLTSMFHGEGAKRHFWDLAP